MVPSASGEASTDDFQVALAAIIAEQLPLPGDKAAGPMGSGGAPGLLASRLMETMHLASIPAQVGPIARQRLADFIVRSADRVPLAERVEPSAHVLGPVLEAIKYEAEDTPVERMLSELLSCAFDGGKAGNLHPAFPTLVRQLSSDEVRVLNRIALNGEAGTLREQFTWHEAPPDDIYDPWTSATWIRTNPYALAEPDKFQLYTEHLSQLGLITASYEHQGPSLDYVNRIRNGELKHVVTATIRLSLTLFGRGFMRAVGG